jgi:hypothetical protein
MPSKNTPTEIINRLNKEISAGLAAPKLRAQPADLGGTVLDDSPADFGKLIAEKWKSGPRSSSSGVPSRTDPRRQVWDEDGSLPPEIHIVSHACDAQPMTGVAAHRQIDAVWENCIFHILAMYEFLHSLGQSRHFECESP